MFLEKVVVGNTLKSVEFADKERAFLIRNECISPPIFDKQKENWHKTIFHLGISGKDIHHGTIDTIRLTSEFIKVNCQLGNFKYEYGTCYVFDYKNLIIEDNKLINHDVSVFNVLDWLEVKQGTNFSDIDSLGVDDSFINEIIFYKSGRVDYDPNFKDIVVNSQIPLEFIEDFDHSLTMVKFYCEQYLSDKYVQPIKLNSVKREKKLLYKPKYKNSKKIKFYD